MRRQGGCGCPAAVTTQHNNLNRITSDRPCRSVAVIVVGLCVMEKIDWLELTIADEVESIGLDFHCIHCALRSVEPHGSAVPACCGPASDCRRMAGIPLRQRRYRCAASDGSDSANSRRGDAGLLLWAARRPHNNQRSSVSSTDQHLRKDCEP